jgi:hypothetical protein
VITVTPDTSKKVYQVNASVPFTLTNNLATLAANCTTNYEWETWVNITATNALVSTVWDSRFDWVQGVPELTVTGLYKFAMSTACGTRIQARQTYPTVYQLQSGWQYARNGNTPASPVFFNEPVTATTTNSYMVLGGLTEMTKPSILSVDYFIYAVNGATNPLTIKMGYGQTAALPHANRVSITTNEFLTAGTTVRRSYYVPALPKINAGYSVPYIEWNLLNVGPRFLTTQFASRPANELEQAAYNAGWRP